MIESRSNTINRNKLAKLTDGDYELIKFLETTQVDASGAVGGSNDALAAATAAAAAAAAAAANAALALSAAAAAQSAALVAQASAASAQTDATSALANAATAQAAAVAAQASANTGIANAATAQTAAVAAQASANSAQTTASSALTLATSINGDYVSKTVVAPQSVADTFKATAYLVGANQVVGARITGWTASTGTAFLGAFNANTTYTASLAYVQLEASTAYAALTEARQRIISIETAMRTHGLIN